MHTTTPPRLGSLFSGVGGLDLAIERGQNLRTTVSLLPTPSATPYGNNQSPSPGAAVRPSLNSIAPALLPTPRASDTGTPGRRASEGFRPPLSQVVLPLLPTPVAADADRNSPTYSRGNPTLRGAITNPPSADGKTSSDDPSPTPWTTEDA